MRNKLSDAFLQALADDFEAHGKRVVEKVRAFGTASGIANFARLDRYPYGTPAGLSQNSRWRHAEADGKSRMLIHRAELLIYPMMSLQPLRQRPS